jgi:hypothetical protein
MNPDGSGQDEIPTGAGWRPDWQPLRRDTTPPIITPSLIGTFGSGGWYTSDVALTWIVTEPESPESLVTTGYADETITSDQAATDYSCAASSDGGSAGPVIVTIKRDSTPPSIAYAGNADTYTVDQSVAIACTASDNLSGLASNTCADISGPAYSFSLGANTFSAVATDQAGNQGSSSTTFSVRVSYDSLCALTQRFVAKANKAKPLCQELKNAERAEARADSKAKANHLAAYRSKVEKERNSTLTHSEADTLRRLAAAL